MASSFVEKHFIRTTVIPGERQVNSTGERQRTKNETEEIGAKGISSDYRPERSHPTSVYVGKKNGKVIFGFSQEKDILNSLRDNF